MECACIGIGDQMHEPQSAALSIKRRPIFASFVRVPGLCGLYHLINSDIYRRHAYAFLPACGQALRSFIGIFCSVDGCDQDARRRGLSFHNSE